MSNKSSSLDYIATSLLKSCAGTFSILISHLANLSFEQATFPSKFKHAFIAPLLKKPGLSRSDPSNFRPISNLNTISLKFLNTLHSSGFSLAFHFLLVFSRLQSVYRKFHPTETALLKLTQRHTGFHWPWQDFNPPCSPWHVCCIRHSWPCHTAS